jgi:hypothetical protein
MENGFGREGIEAIKAIDKDRVIKIDTGEIMETASRTKDGKKYEYSMLV